MAAPREPGTLRLFWATTHDGGHGAHLSIVDAAGRELMHVEVGHEDWAWITAGQTRPCSLLRFAASDAWPT